MLTTSQLTYAQRRICEPVLRVPDRAREGQ
jgi:hypothetical protein